MGPVNSGSPTFLQLSLTYTSEDLSDLRRRNRVNFTLDTR